MTAAMGTPRIAKPKTKPKNTPATRARFDTVLLAVSVAILMIGLVMVLSSSIAIAERNAGDLLFYFKRQTIFALTGIAAGIVIVRIPLSMWQTYGLHVLGIGFLLLLIVLVPGIGDEVNGSQRWVDFGFFKMQASEPARLCFFLYVAGYMVRRQDRVINEAAGLINPMLVIGCASALLLLQPDFGAAAIMVITTYVMLFCGGAQVRWLVGLAALAAAAMAYIVMSSDYRLERFLNFWNPWADATDSGYQLANALIAIGRGEIFGVGLGNSMQKLSYLPEVHTDFIFAVLAEELGLVGALALIALYLLLVARAFMIGREAASNGLMFGAYVAYGIGFWLGFQAFVNISVNLGILPTKGLTLPLMSYGGSSLLVVCAAIALLLRVSYEARTGRLRKGSSRWRIA